MRDTITDDGTIEVALGSLDEAKSFFDGARETQGIYLELDHALQRRDLQQLAKSSGTREGLKKAALKLYMKRIGQR